jgi:hypothetical protein
MKRSIATKTINIDIEYLEFFSEPSKKRATAYLLRGYEDGSGDFHEVEREVITISGQDYAELMAPNPEGKQQDRFRNDDVLTIADRLKAS